jgi:small basic protein
MSFKAFSAIVLGLSIIGFALGIVFGVYVEYRTGNHFWAYLAVPLLASGIALATYGSLGTKSDSDKSEDHSG